MADLVGVPKPDPGPPSEPNAVVEVGVFTVLIIGFFCLIGQGFPAHEAVALTLTLGLGGTQVIQRLRGGGGDRDQR
ncbi:MAG: hypothetical protein ACRDP6_11510 [Actinoallomurus sp.]